jgi:hypothetical protein
MWIGVSIPAGWLQDLHAGEAVVPHELSHHVDARAAGGELKFHDGLGWGVRPEVA